MLTDGFLQCNQVSRYVFKEKTVNADMTYLMNYFYDGEWHQEETTAGDNAVSITLHGCSPVAIFVEANSTAATSPKTGEAPAAAIILMIMVFAAAGMFFSKKKVAESH